MLELKIKNVFPCRKSSFVGQQVVQSHSKQYTDVTKLNFYQCNQMLGRFYHLIAYAKFEFGPLSTFCALVQLSR